MAKLCVSCKARDATAADTAVPFVMARPSFASSVTGSRLAFIKALSAYRSSSPLERIRIVDFPWMAPEMYDKGLRSPEEEMLPRSGIIGIISYFNRSCILSTITGLIAEHPEIKELIRPPVSQYHGLSYQDTIMKLSDKGPLKFNELIGADACSPSKTSINTFEKSVIQSIRQYFRRSIPYITSPF